ncbi:hypothetical protein Tco_1435592 [Tanacetum coccineum]
METEAVNAELLKLGLHDDKGEASETLVNRTPMLKTRFPTMMVFSLLIGTKIDIGEIIYTYLITRLLETLRKKYVAYPRFISCVLERLLNIDYAQDTTLGSTPSVGREALGVPPKVTKGKKQAKPKKTSLIQSTLKFTQEKEQSEATDTSQSVSLDQKGQTTNHKDSEGNKQPADMGLLSTFDEGIRKSQPLPVGKLIDAKDPKRITQLVGMGLPFTHPDEGTHTSGPLPEGTLTVLKDSGSNIQLTNKVLPSTNVIDQSGARTKYRLLRKDSDDELKELSGDDIFEAKEDMDDPFSLLAEETQPPPSTEQLERIIKKRTKNEAKSTKPDSEWKSKEKTKSKSKPKSQQVQKYKFRD